MNYNVICKQFYIILLLLVCLSSESMTVFLLPSAALMTAERFCAAAVLGRERIRTLTRATTPSTLPLRSVCLEEVAC